jgi:prefoldin subunit 5
MNDKEKILRALEDKKEYIVDLGSFTVLAKNEEEAEAEVLERIKDIDIWIEKITLFVEEKWKHLDRENYFIC